MRDYDLTKAKDMYLNYLKWREEFHVDEISKVSAIYACFLKDSIVSGLLSFDFCYYLLFLLHRLSYCFVVVSFLLLSVVSSTSLTFCSGLL